jgi:nucleolar protein 15
VAEVVAESMDGYMLFTRTLVCKQVPYAQLHENTFHGANQKFRAVPWAKLARERGNKKKTTAQVAKRTKKLVKGDAKKRAALKALGIDYEFGGYAAAAAAAAGGDATTTTEKKKTTTTTKAAAAAGGAKKRKAATVDAATTSKSAKKTPAKKQKKK